MTGCHRAEVKKVEMPPTPVAVIPVAQTNIPVELETFGVMEAPTSVVIRCQVSGMLTNIHFREGQVVEPGDLLFTLDARPFEAALAKAEATLIKTQVQWKNALVEAERELDLLTNGLTSQETYDAARTQAEALGAEVKAQEALVTDARLDVEHCTIRSPLKGRTGERHVSSGNLVKANDEALVIINQISPIYCTFSLPQQHLEGIRERFGRAPLSVAVTVPPSSGPAESGTLIFVDNHVDAATGTIRLKGQCENSDERLWPGQFVRVTLRLREQPEALVVPSHAVLTGQRGAYVFVIGQDQRAEERAVAVDRVAGVWTVIARGLAAGELVVTEGLQRLATGTQVVIPTDGKGAAQP